MLNKKPLKLNKDFEYALAQMEKTDTHYFITGRAGTGKSTLLGTFRNTTKKKVVVLAPTGIAALNVKGQTIHSFFGFPPKLLSPDEIRKRKNHRMYKNIDMIIIDEISMVRADMLDNIDRFMRINGRDVTMPFGGAQVVVFGDMFQLPPVVATMEEKELFSGYYESPYFFSAKVFDQGFWLDGIELRTNFRQESRHFQRLLDAIRLNHMDYDDLEDLNIRYLPDEEVGDYYITLSARNAVVNQINKEKIAKVEGEERMFIPRVTGAFNERLFPTTTPLILKEGAQVMFVKNDPKKQFVNGTIGKVIEISEDLIKVSVRRDDDKTELIEVERMIWEIQKYKLDQENPDDIKSDVIGSFEQFPLKLAWAMTIHKSQGKTFDRVIINMQGGAFEHGQTYVALSRCRTLEGIILRKRIEPRDIMVDERIVQYYEQNF